MTEITPQPESLAVRAARAVLEAHVAADTEGLDIWSPGENPLSAIGWGMGDWITYEAAVEEVVTAAINLREAEREPHAFKAGDDVVSFYEDDAGVWTVLELTKEDAEALEWHTAATLLLSDVEAADLARRLTDRTAS